MRVAHVSQASLTALSREERLAAELEARVRAEHAAKTKPLPTVTMWDAAAGREVPTTASAAAGAGAGAGAARAGAGVGAGGKSSIARLAAAAAKTELQIALRKTLGRRG